MKPSNVVDLYSDTANMFGCEPCPACGDKYRAVYKSGQIECDNCGHKELAVYRDNEI